MGFRIMAPATRNDGDGDQPTQVAIANCDWDGDAAVCRPVTGPQGGQPITFPDRAALARDLARMGFTTDPPQNLPNPHAPEPDGAAPEPVDAPPE